MNIFEALRKDHDKQRALMKVVLDTSGDSEVRSSFFKLLKESLEAHAIAEERHFYGPLLQEDETIGLSRHGIAEHHQLDKLIEKLEHTDMSSPQWLPICKDLANKLEHHLAEEEKEFFQQAGKILSDKQKEDLAEKYEAEMDV